MNAVEIANLALTYLGENTITALDSDESPTAATMALLYPVRKEAGLKSWPWKFATKTVDLSAEVATPTNDRYTSQYVMPADFVAMIETDLPGEDYEFETASDETLRLLSTRDTITIRYVADVAADKFPIDFVQALAYDLAANAALAIQGEAGAKTAPIWQQQASNAWARAKAQDGGSAPARIRSMDAGLLMGRDEGLFRGPQ